MSQNAAQGMNAMGGGGDYQSRLAPGLQGPSTNPILNQSPEAYTALSSFSPMAMGQMNAIYGNPALGASMYGNMLGTPAYGPQGNDAQSFAPYLNQGVLGQWGWTPPGQVGMSPHPANVANLVGSGPAAMRNDNPAAGGPNITDLVRQVGQTQRDQPQGPSFPGYGGGWGQARDAMWRNPNLAMYGGGMRK
jgi:hypothetical protein